MVCLYDHMYKIIYGQAHVVTIYDSYHIRKIIYEKSYEEGFWIIYEKSYTKNHIRKDFESYIKIILRKIIYGREFNHIRWIIFGKSYTVWTWVIYRNHMSNSHIRQNHIWNTCLSSRTGNPCSPYMVNHMWVIIYGKSYMSQSGMYMLMYDEMWGCKHRLAIIKLVVFQQHGADTPGCLFWWLVPAPHMTSHIWLIIYDWSHMTVIYDRAQTPLIERIYGYRLN